MIWTNSWIQAGRRCANSAVWSLPSSSHGILLSVHVVSRQHHTTADQLPEWISATDCEGEPTQKQALDYAISGGAAIYSQLSHLRSPSLHPPQLYPEIPLFAATLQKLFPRHRLSSFFPPSATPLERIGSDVATFLSLPFLLLHFRMRDGFFFPFVALRKQKKTLAIVAQVWFSLVPFWFELW